MREIRRRGGRLLLLLLYKASVSQRNLSVCPIHVENTEAKIRITSITPCCAGKEESKLVDALLLYI